MSVASTPISGRMNSLDHFKGGLVILMVIYHSTFVVQSAGSSETFASITISLYFLHAAFVFAAGFLVGHHYQPKLKRREQGVRRRLLQRGIKIYLLFAVCNVVLVASRIGPPWSQIRSLLDTPWELVHNAMFAIPGKSFSFEILAYIALFLIASSVAIGRTLVAWTLASWLLFAVFDLPLSRMLAVGFTGAVLGATAVSVAGIAARIPSSNATFWVLFVLSRPLTFLAYLHAPAVVRELVVVFDSLMYWRLFDYLAKTFPRALSKMLLKLGQQTLFAYLFHLAIIRLIAQVDLPRRTENPVEIYLITVAGVLALTYLAVLVSGYARSKSSVFRSCYRLALE